MSSICTKLAYVLDVTLLVDNDPSYGGIAVSQPTLQSYAPSRGAQLRGYLHEGNFSNIYKPIMFVLRSQTKVFSHKIDNAKLEFTD